MTRTVLKNNGKINIYALCQMEKYFCVLPEALVIYLISTERLNQCNINLTLYKVTFFKLV